MSDVTVYAPGRTVEVIARDPVPVDPPASGSWSQIGNGGSVGAYFRRPVMLANGNIWAAWGGNGAADRGSWIFDRSLGDWIKTSSVQGVGHDIGSRENYGAWFDPARNKVLIGAGAPVAYSQLGDLAFDLATNTYVEEYSPPNNLIGGDAAFLCHAGIAYAFGGWSNNGCVQRDLVTGAKSSFGGSPRPQFTQQASYGSAEADAPRLTYARSGVDNRDGTLWALANDNELWWCPVNGAWAMFPTTGDKPTTLGIVATLVEGSNQVVAWCGKTGMVAATAGIALRQTWVLDLATLVWSRGPGLPMDVVPTAAVMCQNNFLSDGVSAILLVDMITGTEVWRYA